MTFSWDFNTATLIAIGAQIALVIVYLVKTNGKATAAYKKAELAFRRADEAHVSIAAQSASLGLFREHVASEYIDRDSLREMEQRLTTTINRLGDRLDLVIERRPQK